MRAADNRRPFSFHVMSQILYTPIGDMIHKIDLLNAEDENSRASDGSYPADPGVFVAGIYAKIEGLSAREVYKGQVITSEVVERVTIRGPNGGNSDVAGIRTRMLVRKTSDEKIFQIQGIIDPDGRGVELRLLCVERDDGE